MPVEYKPDHCTLCGCSPDVVDPDCPGCDFCRVHGMPFFVEADPRSEFVWKWVGAILIAACLYFIVRIIVEYGFMVQ